MPPQTRIDGSIHELTQCFRVCATQSINCSAPSPNMRLSTIHYLSLLLNLPFDPRNEKTGNKTDHCRSKAN